MKYKSHTTTAALILAMSLVGARAATTHTFQEGVNGYAGTKDTQIRFGSPDRDDGQLDGINPDKSDGGGEVHGFIRFDDIFGSGPGQIPPGSSILNASLTLYLVNPGNSPTMNRILKPWEESTTWNTWDPTSSDGITADDVEAAAVEDAKFTVPSGTPYFKTIELSAKTIQDWLDGKTKNYGWGFIPDGTDGVDFDSSEGGVPAQRPKLTVVVGVAGEAFVKEFKSTPVDIQFTVDDGTLANGQPNPINANSITLTLDGEKVTHQATKTGNTTTISYKVPTFMASGSSHTAKLVFSDNSTPPKTQTIEQKFNVPVFPTLQGSWAVTGVDTTKGGFKARVTQMSATRPNGDQNSANNAERQLANRIIDPATEQPYANDADLTTAVNGIFTVDSTINWNQDAPSAAGNFSGTSTPPVEDQPIPGIPGINGENNNIAAEILTFLDLPAGFHRFGVNSDDGFKLTVGPGSADVFAQVLGLFNTGRGSADSFMDFAVEKAGLYPVRLTWWEGGGGANLEFFSVDPATGQKILINDRSNPKGIKAYREGPASAFAPRPEFQVLVPIDNKHQWRYENTGKDLGTAWREKAFNDSSWPQGPGMLAAESGSTVEPIRTPLVRQSPEGNQIVADYFRTRFTFNGNPATARLAIRHAVDDGVVIYLNGVEVHRFGLAAGATFTNSTFFAGHENDLQGPFEISNASLVQGENVLAAEVHQSDAGSSDSVFGLELFGLIGAATPVEPAKFSKVSRTGASLSLEWTGTGTLQSADAVTGPWTDIANAKSPFSAAIAGTAKFYRFK